MNLQKKQLQKKLFSSVNVIGTTFFDIFCSMWYWKTFLYEFIVTLRFFWPHVVAFFETSVLKEVRILFRYLPNILHSFILWRHIFLCARDFLKKLEVCILLRTKSQSTCDTQMYVEEQVKNADLYKHVLNKIKTTRK